MLWSNFQLCFLETACKFAVFWVWVSGLHFDFVFAKFLVCSMNAVEQFSTLPLRNSMQVLVCVSGLHFDFFFAIFSVCSVNTMEQFSTLPLRNSMQICHVLVLRFWIAFWFFIYAKFSVFNECYEAIFNFAP